MLFLAPSIRHIATMMATAATLAPTLARIGSV
jgi:hypothetical protein